MIENPETLRIHMNIALRNAERSFDRGDYDMEIWWYERADELQHGIWHAETLLKSRSR